MRPEPDLGNRQPATVIAWSTAKRTVRSGVMWGALFGLLVWNEALGWHKSFPTVASREKFAHTLGANSGVAAIIGPARRVDTIGGFVAWRMFGTMIIVGAIWGLLTASRSLRGEEDSGRWELFLAGRTNRRQATGQATVGLAAGWVTLWAVTAGLTLAAGSRPNVGFSASASLFYATAATASAAIFLAVGAVTSQLATTRRQANGLAAAAFALCYLIRMVADAGVGLAWLRWASPLGWVENLRPLTGSQPLALLPVVLLIGSAAGAAIGLAGRRDLGAAVVERKRSASESTQLLGGATVMVAQLERWVTLAWAGGLAALALIFGIVARSAAAGDVAVNEIKQQLGRLGGHPQSAVAAWIGYEFIFLATLLAFAAAGQISAMRTEEADGHLDNLVARHLDRDSWMAGRLGFAVAFVLVAAFATGIGGWIGVAARQSDVGFLAMIQAGVNIAVPALFVLGLGALLYAVVPRLAASILYVLILWSFLIEIIGSSITSNHWLLDTAMMSHLGPVPATSLQWTTIAIFIALGIVAAAAALPLFKRRDLVAA